MIRVGTFIGELPRLAPRYLPETAAQRAYNCRLDDGALTPIRMARLAATLPAPALTIYRHNDQWLSWPVSVKVVPGPVAQDRLYVSGDGAPKIVVGGQTYDLAIRGPAAAPTVTTEGEIDEKLFQTVLYAYTFVTDLGEESEPSPLSASIDWSAGMTNTLSGFDQAPPPRVTRMRFYRTQTGQSGATNLFFISDRPYTTAPFVDVWGTNPLVEPIPSVSYNPPPEGLQGLIALPNGMMAGFVGKKVYFSEPYIPHAWPEKYVLTVDYPVVGLGSFGSSLAIMTTGNPYVAMGSAPENMQMENLEINLPCVSARGIVDLGYAIAYPSHNGLVTISNNGAALITENTIGKERWQELNPGGMVAGQYNGRYMASYARGTIDGAEDRGIIIIDTSGAVPHVSRTSDFADYMLYQIETGALFLLRNRNEIWEWDAAGQPNGELVWRSKPVVHTGYTNYAFIYIEAEGILTPAQAAVIREKINKIRAKNRELMDSASIGGEVGGSFVAGMTFAGDSLIPAADYGMGEDGVGYDEAVAVTVFADGREVATITDLNAPARLPSGFLAKKWEFEVRGNMQVLGVSLGMAPSELAEAV